MSGPPPRLKTIQTNRKRCARQYPLSCQLLWKGAGHERCARFAELEFAYGMALLTCVTTSWALQSSSSAAAEDSSGQAPSPWPSPWPSVVPSPADRFMTGAVTSWRGGGSGDPGPPRPGRPGRPLARRHGRARRHPGTKGELGEGWRTKNREACKLHVNYTTYSLSCNIRFGSKNALKTFVHQNLD